MQEEQITRFIVHGKVELPQILLLEVMLQIRFYIPILVCYVQHNL